MRHATNRWITCLRSLPAARLRLICIPYAGGGASVFRKWPDLLPPEIELCAVQLPGRETRILETPLADLEALTDQLRTAIAPYLNRPFALFGHSKGALVAYVLTRALRRHGDPLPIHLFASGRRAPHLPARRGNLHHLPDHAFIQELRRLGGTPEEVLQNPEMMDYLLPMLRADFRLTEAYVHEEEPPLDVPISAYGGESDAHVSVEEIVAWEAHTRRAFRTCIYPGGHFFLHTESTRLFQELGHALASQL